MSVIIYGCNYLVFTFISQTNWTHLKYNAFCFYTRWMIGILHLISWAPREVCSLFCSFCLASVQDKLMAWNCFLLFFLFTTSLFAILHTILPSWMTSDGIFPLCKKSFVYHSAFQNHAKLFFSRKYITGNNVMQMMSRYICACALSWVEIKYKLSTALNETNLHLNAFEPPRRKSTPVHLFHIPIYVSV